MLKPETQFWIKTGLNVLSHPAPFGVFVGLFISILFLISLTAFLWIPYLFSIFAPNIHIFYSFILGIVVAIVLFFFLTIRSAYYFFIKGFM